MVKQTDYMKGLTAAEKEYQIYTNEKTLTLGVLVSDEKLHQFAMSHMRLDLDVDFKLGYKSQSYLDGYSDYLWQIEYRRNN